MDLDEGSMFGRGDLNQHPYHHCHIYLHEVYHMHSNSFFFRLAININLGWNYLNNDAMLSNLHLHLSSLRDSNRSYRTFLD